MTFIAILLWATAGIVPNASALVLTNNSDLNADVEVLDFNGFIRCEATSLSPKQKYVFRSGVCKLDQYSVTFKVARDGHARTCKVQTGAKGKVVFDGTNCKVQ